LSLLAPPYGEREVGHRPVTKAELFRRIQSEPARSVKKWFKSGVRLAGSSQVAGKVIPHTLRYTAATG
jgi:hypothetical protein